MRHVRTCSPSARGYLSHTRRLTMLLCAMAAGLLAVAALAARADAAAFIQSGDIELGVGDRGHLIVPGGTPSSNGTTHIGLRYLPTNGEGLGTNGNQYEGWGAADVTSGVTGYTSPTHPGYTAGVQLVSFTHTATSALSVVDVVGAGGSGTPATLRVTHDYHPTPSSPDLFEATVTIQNVSNQTVDPRYRRVMNWSVTPTPTDELVTIGGTPFAALLSTSNCGYALPDPLQSNTTCGGVPLHTGFFTDAGPQDEGAAFDFALETLSPNESVSFQIYFGATADEDAAEAAVGDVNAETWSFGQANTTDGPTLGTPNTFIFAFSSASGPAVPNDMRLRQVTPAAIDGPDQFDVRAELKNTGTHDATSVQTEIVLPAGLTLVSGSTQHAFAGTVLSGQEVDHTWHVSAPGDCFDVTYEITITATFSDPAGGGPFTRSRSRDLLVRGTCAAITGRVTDRNTGTPIAGAYLSVCVSPSGACLPNTTTDVFGRYAFSGIPADSYTVSVNPGGAYIPASRGVALGAGQHATEDFQLSDLHGPPTGTGVSAASGTNPDGVPLIPRVPTTVTTHGCPGAPATFTVKRGETVLASGPMSEGPAGTYTSAPFGPFMGIVTIATAIACQGEAPQTTEWSAIYIDPSGHVRTTDGDAIAGATVTLLRSDAASGPFAKVPDGDAIMSPANRKNSDLTDVAGHFGWDVIPGYYKVRASKEGCTAADGTDTVESAVMQIPPPVTDLDLRLRCPKPPSTGETPEQPEPGGSPGSPQQPAPGPGGSPGSPQQPGSGPGGSPKPVAAGVRIGRRGSRILVRLTCPRRAGSACSVTAALRLAKPASQARTRVVTLVTRRVVVAAGKTATLSVRRAQIATTRNRLRLHVKTRTSAGTRAASYAIPR